MIGTKGVVTRPEALGRPAYTERAVVVGHARYSICLLYDDPDRQCEWLAWFRWEPGRVGHGKQHGVPSEAALIFVPDVA